ncbi:MAG TPA: cyanophycin synthetase, partial [Solirubrobacteraceae bacterium]
VQLRFGERPSSPLRLLDGELRWRGQPLLGESEIPLPGAHNVQNALAAATICLARELPLEAVAEGLRTFAGVPHRLELVAVRHGVRYINDSKATNVASTLVALRSFPGRIHLILGGKGKAQDFGPLASLVSERCTAVYLIGEDAGEIAGALAGTKVPLIPAGDLERAVAIAALEARDGAVVLLSPACASFDQYRDYEARGDHFRALALGLAEGSD